MSIKHFIAVAVTTATVFAVAAPTSASGQSVEFVMSGGSLAVSIDSSTKSLSGLTFDGTEQDATGSLGAVTVTDTRGVVTDWTVSVSSTVFTHTTHSSTAVVYAAGEITDSGVAATTPTASITVGTEAVTVVNGDITEAGLNSASWSPTLTVTMPGDALPGTYTGTVTTSVS